MASLKIIDNGSVHLKLAAAMIDTGTLVSASVCQMAINKP